MNKNIAFLFYMLLCINYSCAQQNLAQKLGYQKDAKLLIIHADDLGVSHSENAASIKAIETSPVNSASVMMPTPWINEIASYAKTHTGKHDLGIHLVVTAEWENYKWGSVASANEVSSLLDQDGYFYKSCPFDADLKEVEIELKAQIDLAYTMGIIPTHLDTHMACLLRENRPFLEIYLKLGKDYNLPCLIDQSMLARFDSKEEFEALLKKYDVAIVADELATIVPADFKKGTTAYYINLFKNLKPGLTQLNIHLAYDSAEMQAMTINHPDWGSKWRQADFDFFTSDTCKQLLEEENIKLVSWREIAKTIDQ